MLNICAGSYRAKSIVERFSMNSIRTWFITSDNFNNKNTNSAVVDEKKFCIYFINYI